MMSSDDLVTAVEFDESGDYLAVGDKAGRICIFDCHHIPPQPSPHPSPHSSTSSPHSRSSQSPSHQSQASPSHAYQPTLEYKFYTEFQSHEPEFDCLKSLEIEEKINCIRWSSTTKNNALYLLATNDKTIKLWKVYDKKIYTNNSNNNTKRSTNNTHSASPHSHSYSHHYGSKQRSEFITAVAGQGQGGLQVPRLSASQTVTTAAPKRVYSNAHGYHINSISINSDQQTFISADDLRINLWNLDYANESFNIVDIRPSNIEELTEVITAATFSPTHCHLLAYATSRGSVRLIDLREQALCDSHSRQFEQEDDVSGKSFFSEISASIADVKFAGSEGRYVVSRDYLTVKVWDVTMENRPLYTIAVHDYLKPHLCDLYENDCIFDQFDCSISSSGTRGITGSYNNHFVLWALDEMGVGGGGGGGAGDAASIQRVTVEALKDGPRRREAGGVTTPASSGGAERAGQWSSSARKLKQTQAAKAAAKDNGSGSAAAAAAAAGGGGVSGADKDAAFNVNVMDFGKKALHVGWHPRLNAVAVAGLNKLYIYQAVNAATER